jgi:hypothetical protein
MSADVIARWRRGVDDTAARLRSPTDGQVRVKPAPGKWSIKELVGHLIDSANNNHRRFVIAQIRPGLVFDGYEQDEWVSLQRYQESPWPALVDLWQGYNHHLMQVASAIPAAVLDRPETNHNFHDIATRSVPKGEPTTLRFFIEDYVIHLEQHVKQINDLLER